MTDPEPDSYEAWQANYEAWQARRGNTDRQEIAKAMRWFAAEYPDPWSTILARRNALKEEAEQLHAPGRHTKRTT